MLKTIIKNNAPSFSLRWMQKVGLIKHAVPAVGRVHTGDMNTVKPFSSDFGYDRGGPIDRYYIENFLQKEAAAIKGRVLEIGDNEYTLKYGGSRITKSDILDVNEKNPKATFLVDISDAPVIPDNTFDTIILTQTLHLIYDFKAALRTCYRILKPGGTLLLTVPGITPIDAGGARDIWYWSFTDKSMKKVMTETFAPGSAEVNCFGNVYAASSFLFGMGLPEVSTKKLDYQDPLIQVVITVKGIK